MNDVLPKPFTKEGMIRCLEKHLARFKAPSDPRDFGIQATNDQHPGYVTTSGTVNQPLNMNNISHISAPQSSKGDSPTVRSPATSWHSPTSNSMTCPSPTSAATSDSYNMHQLRQGANGYVMGNTMSGLRNMESPTSQIMPAPRMMKHRRVMSDMTNGPEENSEAKRQRLYVPQQLGNNTTPNNFT